MVVRIIRVYCMWHMRRRYSSSLQQARQEGASAPRGGLSTFLSTSRLIRTTRYTQERGFRPRPTTAGRDAAHRDDDSSSSSSLRRQHLPMSIFYQQILSTQSNQLRTDEFWTSIGALSRLKLINLQIPDAWFPLNLPFELQSAKLFRNHERRAGKSKGGGNLRRSFHSHG